MSRVHILLRYLRNTFRPWEKYYKKLINRSLKNESIILQIEREIAKIRGDLKVVSDVVRGQHAIFADVSVTPNNSSYFVVAGKYRGQDYVKIFRSNNPNSLDEVLAVLSDMSKAGIIHSLDAHPSASREIKNYLKYY